MSVEPRTFDNPYEGYMSPGAMETGCQDGHEMENYHYAPGPPLYQLAEAQDPSWTSENRRVPNYPSGFPAFAPSPGPMVEYYHGHGGASVPQSPEDTKPEKRSHSGKNASAKGKGKGDSKGWEHDDSKGWEHAVVAKGGLTYVTVHSEEPRKKGGVRTGPLGQEARERARKIRQERACWNCWIQKVPVRISPPN